jgi:hypothetical protein
VATEAMIAAACRNPTRAVSISNPDATLYRPRGYEDAEAEERAKAGRQVLRLVLAGHDCAALPACPDHGRDVCDCHPCLHPDHADDMALALEALETFGLKDADALTRRCSTCHLVKNADRFPNGKETCKTCLYRRSKAAREAGQQQ